MARTPSCKTFPAVSRKKDGEAVRAGEKLTAVLGSVPEQMEGQLKGAMVREAFAQAIIDEYGTEAAAYYLENIQLVYLRKDDKNAKKSSTGPAPVYLDVYTTEAIIKADLDSRQEAIKRRLRAANVHFDRLKPYSSTGDMRHRKPFEARAAELKAQLVQEHAEGEGVEGEGEASGEAWTDERINEMVAQVEDPHLQDAIRRAMQVSLQ